MPPVIRTFSGGTINLLNPLSEDIWLEDIAHGLSNLCRFTGQTRTFYSVAEHSVLVSLFLPHETALWGLLHDASEAYLGDVSAPLKQLLPEYKEIEEHMERTIFARFGLYGPRPDIVKWADEAAYARECRDLMGVRLSGGPRLTPEQAKHHFMGRFAELMR